ncbi:shikimate kinase [Sanguibacter gelidistatuariae]|uniref:Shikimate kinase n=1 Tax=Sanguibacter gelidistatuariae TaxID=1814289 RepID=A0A1G6JPI0_9MICO|nr:shikimate kinase [Sanguibacter gelidistatuariae]SDC20588.1 shikimate kinase [Sanguibacter gelidistatuariae]
MTPVPQPPRSAPPAPAVAPHPSTQASGRGPRVVLVGPPGSGKSTTGHALAHALGVAWRDTDADVEVTAGKAIADIFFDEGEPHFRALERQAVAAALAEHDGVLALGGGAVLDEVTESALAAYSAAGGVVVFLDVSLAQVAPRVGFNQARPLLLGNPRSKWQALMVARRPVYERVARVHVHTDNKTPSQVAQEILRALTAEVPHPTSTEDPA